VSAPAGTASAPRGAALDPRRLALHWRKTRILTVLLLVLWMACILGVGVFARDLARIHFFGWPLSYYMGAQGLLVVFLLIIGCYAVVMNRLDREARESPVPAQASPVTSSAQAASAASSAQAPPANCPAQTQPATSPAQTHGEPH